MVLFERDSKDVQRFFACSAYRDRKLCSAYFLEENWNKAQASKNTVNRKQSYLISELEELTRLQLDVLPKIRQRRIADRLFCSTCGILCLDAKKHANHKTIKGISDELLQQPSLVNFLLNPVFFVSVDLFFPFEA